MDQSAEHLQLYVLIFARFWSLTRSGALLKSIPRFGGELILGAVDSNSRHQDSGFNGACELMNR